VTLADEIMRDAAEEAEREAAAAEADRAAAAAAEIAAAEAEREAQEPSDAERLAQLEPVADGTPAEPVSGEAAKAESVESRTADGEPVAESGVAVAQPVPDAAAELRAVETSGSAEFSFEQIFGDVGESGEVLDIFI
jgi:hypothetical protein